MTQGVVGSFAEMANDASGADDDPVIGRTQATIRIESTQRIGVGHMRNGGIEIARFVGGLGIVWFHSGAPGATIGYAGLPMFTLLLVAFAWRSGEKRTLGEYATDRFKRLVAPWLFWSVVYGALKIADGISNDFRIGNEFEWWMLLTGPALHLWFLPFAFVACIFAAAISVLVAKSSPALVLVIGLPALLAAVVGCSLWITLSRPPTPVAQWLFVLPSCLAGMCISQVKPGQYCWAAAVIFAAIVPSLVLAEFGIRSLFIAHVVGVSLASLLWVLRITCTNWMLILGSLSLGIYLVHPIIGVALERLALLPPQSFTSAIAQCLVSAVFVWLLQRSVLKRFV